MLTLMFLAISGSSLLSLLLWIVIIGTIFGLLWWLIQYVGLPAPFDKIARVVLAIIAVVFLINALLSVVGEPFIRF